MVGPADRRQPVCVGVCPDCLVCGVEWTGVPIIMRSESIGVVAVVSLA